MSNENANMQTNEAINEERMMYGHGHMTEQELDEKYPNRPHNHSKTLPFHELHLTLFNPLNENKKKPTGPVQARKKQGPHGVTRTPHETRRYIIERFISRWRAQVGDDIYPAFRLIVPEKDRDRAMYGLKEATLGKLLVKVMKIDKNSEDGYSLLHWKLPGTKASSTMAGDFAGRCFEVISKRPMRTSPGDMTIAEVNEQLDKLAVAQKEESQQPIIREFYNRMNAEEMMWLIRMILRQMKVGATERTIFDIWHPDAENLFNISSSLRRVCWELYDPQVRLEGKRRGIHLMQCFQPQLAAFQMQSWNQILLKMNTTEEDPIFWIEEKLDGERMQLHMMQDKDHPGGMKFGFWSRKAKDYTYLYGNGFQDQNGALTRHLKHAFHDGVRNIILDGEMITWDPKQDAIVPFGTLKTAAIAEQNNPFADGNRPVYRVFDCLYLNGVDLTNYVLRKRYEALRMSIKDVHRRLEVHDHIEARDVSEIETRLRKVVAESSEGLVLKNPRSPYRLNERNDDWIKVKPEYMTEFGEALDCVVIGGYFGSGRRGGRLSSFLCGLHVDQNLIDQGANPQKCYSFFKVGGGFTAEDYARLRHHTDGKWHEWDAKKPPTDWIILAGGDKQLEKPDVWIKPEDSVVLSVKAASVTATDSFATKLTLRFPRFQKLRMDKDWKSSLTFREFMNLKARVEVEREEKQFKIDDARRKRSSRKRKRALPVQGQSDTTFGAPYGGPATKIFDGLKFFIATDASKPLKKSKADLEKLVTANGGTVVASPKDLQTIVIADKRVVKVASLQTADERNIIRPSWLIDCINQSEVDTDKASFLLPLEPRYIFSTQTVDSGKFDENVDKYGDSYAKDVTAEELMALFNGLHGPVDHISNALDLLQDSDVDQGADLMRGFMFQGVCAYCPNIAPQSLRLLRFAGGDTVNSLDGAGITHIIVTVPCNDIKTIRHKISSRNIVPRIVTERWIKESWREGTRLDEERRHSSPVP